MAEGIGEPESEHSGRSSVVERRSPCTGEVRTFAILPEQNLLLCFWNCCLMPRKWY